MAAGRSRTRDFAIDLNPGSATMPKADVRRRRRVTTKSRSGARPRSGRPAGSVRAPRARAAPVEATSPVLTLSLPSGQEFAVRHTPDMRRAAMEWSYVLRNRRRWAETESARVQQSQRTRALMHDLGVDDGALQAMAEARLVEVAIPWEGEAKWWETRLLPWEFLLSSATRPYRKNEALTVVRHLSGRDSRLAAAAPRRALFVESAPRAAGQKVAPEFDRRLVRHDLGLETRTLENPTRARLAAAVAAAQADVIHVTGFDSHQAVELGLVDSPDDPLDGILLAREDKQPELCDAEALAHLLASGRRPPRLAAFDFYRSAARTAALTVAAGAHAAIGFQDVIDDASAEIFWSNFYRAWPVSDWDLLTAFVVARLVLRAQPQTQQGNGIVLWSDTSLIAAHRAEMRAGRARTAARPPSVEVVSKQVLRQLDEDKRRQVTPQAFDQTPDVLSFHIETVPRLNYSVLHNERPLFQTFQVLKRVAGLLAGLQIEVSLDAGPEPVRFSGSFDVEETASELCQDIRLPLTSTLMRSAAESIRTNLSVVARWQNRELLRRSYPVTLLPIDEWLDTDDDRMWLPSFVQPRDPGVLRVLQSAHRYLAALTDDLAAGFDGYQSWAPDDPSGVDLQVQALWSALLQDFGLHYINPPPSSTNMSQRLRSPSEVIEGRQGTCIDLALLLCACLEYIDIHPAIILLEGHAFPAYWRSDDAYQQFQAVAAPSSVAPTSRRTTTGDGAQRYSWYLEQWAYPEVLQQVRKGALVPLETVWLTSQSGFSEAMDEGFRNLRSERDFNSLIDVTTARVRGVTPLPVVRKA